MEIKKTTATITKEGKMLKNKGGENVFHVIVYKSG